MRARGLRRVALGVERRRAQLRRGRVEPLAPEAQLGPARFGARLEFEPLCPAPEGRADGQRLGPRPRGGEVGLQDAPGDAVDDEVVGDEQQPAGFVGPGVQPGRAQHPPGRRIEPGDRGGALRLDRGVQVAGGAGDADGRQHVGRAHGTGGRDVERPAVVVGEQAGAQQIVAVEQLLQRGRTRSRSRPAGTVMSCDWWKRSIGPPSSRSHATIGVAGTRPMPAPGASAAGPARSPAAATRPATVRAPNTSRGVIVRPARRARLTSGIATMLSPPSAKKSSWTPTEGSPSTSANSSASVASAAVAGSASPVSAAQSGAGSALRSSLPFGVSGSAPSSTIAVDGTMYSGSRSASAASCCAGSSVAPSCATT